ncbi:MAG: response regulator [Flavobacterium sp.]|nr:MAG: response regulator [Flavobacterium sp.]
MPENRKLHILIAEDDADDGEVIVDSFSKHGAFERVDWVKHGRELLDYLDNASELPDVILTDINMPILNGIEALEEIAQHSNLRRIPAVVFSSTINPVYKARCEKLGTAGFLTKPFTLRGFDEIPDKILSLLETRDTV